jgi:large subunit ribosomal protein L23
LSNQYVFKVAIDASKLEVKRSVEQLFKVKVVNVNTLRVKGKVKRNKNGYSTKSTWKKAYVKLEQGHDIDFALAD